MLSLSTLHKASRTASATSNPFSLSVPVFPPLLKKVKIRSPASTDSFPFFLCIDQMGSPTCETAALNSAPDSAAADRIDSKYDTFQCWNTTDSQRYGFNIFRQAQTASTRRVT